MYVIRVLDEEYVHRSARLGTKPKWWIGVVRQRCSTVSVTVDVSEVVSVTVTGSAGGRAVMVVVSVTVFVGPSSETVIVVGTVMVVLSVTVLLSVTVVVSVTVLVGTAILRDCDSGRYSKDRAFSYSCAIGNSGHVRHCSLGSVLENSYSGRYCNGCTVRHSSAFCDSTAGFGNSPRLATSRHSDRRNSCCSRRLSRPQFQVP